MQNSQHIETQHTEIAHIRHKRVSYLLLCCLVFSLHLSASIFVTSLTFAGQASSQSIFSWFTGDDDKQQDELLSEEDDTPQIKDEAAKQKAIFGELVYHYFQHDYQQVLQLIAVGNAKHGFVALSPDDTDRLHLIQGAAQLQLGLYTQSQAKFASLLSQTTSEYVQANTWFFMAKAGFENKQGFLTERAYEAIIKDDLRDILSTDNWHELLYLTAYTRMQAGQDWQSLQSQIPLDNIYTAYLLANHASRLFNNSEYAQATATFTKAKRALQAFKNRRGFVSRVASSVFDTVLWIATPWRWFDSNATAEQTMKARQEAEEVAEQNALFDRINLGLGQSLLQQGELGNAIAVLQTVADGGADADQALLTFGWANAKENRWQNAMSAWQYLQQNSIGLFSLQANYGLAYAFSQQDNLGQAFFALQSTAIQIDDNLNALDTFAAAAQKDQFFDNYQQQWPEGLADLKLGFFTPADDFDARYLLTMRSQAEIILSDIQDKQNRITQLNTVLTERQATYDSRLQSLSLRDAKMQITQTQEAIDNIKTLIKQANTFEQQLNLAKQMTSEGVSDHLSRLDGASARHARLAADTSRKRPLKASYQERLQRIEGILTWQLMDDYVEQQWQHQQLLKLAQVSLIEAKNQYEKLQNIAQKQDAFSLQREQFSALNKSLGEQTEVATRLYNLATNTLTFELLSLIDARKSQLKEQGVNTRLAMLRIQDLQQPGGQ